MAQTPPEPLEAPDSLWRLLLRLRWPLGGAIALAFALGQVAEALLWADAPARLLGDVLAWGALGGLAVWLSLTWVSRQERRYERRLAAALATARQLNADLARANDHLQLLSAANRELAESASMDEILDAALHFPRRLVPARSAALVLIDGGTPIAARSAGAPAAMLAQWRAAFGIDLATAAGRRLQVRPAPPDAGPGPAACLVLPLHDGVAPVGWIELYLDAPPALPPDVGDLLETIAGETAEVILSARRRMREERAAFALERALAEERARIARDIHDGLAQSLAFVRLRVDLWLDWIATNPARLHDELLGLKATLREQIAELRRAIFALLPVAFDELGFAGGMQRYLAEFAAQQGWEAEADLSGAPPDLGPDREAVCFRVVQEALTNVAKHAAATHVVVTIDQRDGGLRLRVRDDGRGFAPDAVAAGGAAHVGLRQMRARLAALRGRLTLDSRPGAGTELTAWFPLAPPAPAERAP